jgi:hypothetical protein
VHIPTGGIMSKYAFLDADDCRDALVDYWTRLTPELRQRLVVADLAAMQTDLELMQPFRFAFIEKAELIVDAAESEVASG